MPARHLRSVLTLPLRYLRSPSGMSALAVGLANSRMPSASSSPNGIQHDH